MGIIIGIVVNGLVEVLSPLINQWHQNKMELLQFNEKLQNITNAKAYLPKAEEASKWWKIENLYYILVFAQLIFSFFPSPVYKLPAVGPLLSLLTYGAAVPKEPISQETLRNALTELERLLVLSQQTQAQFELLRQVDERMGTALTSLERTVAAMQILSASAPDIGVNVNAHGEVMTPALQEYMNEPVVEPVRVEVRTFDASQIFGD